jgi:ornithine cyclodeaminase/alanine dehydrogenase-like protein (mu-crystallin family)
LPLYLTERDVDGLVTAGEAVEAIEECFQRMARGAVDILPRRRLRLEDGALAVMAASDRELGMSGSKSYAAAAGKVEFIVNLFEGGETVAVIEADRLGQLRTGAASGVAARHLAKSDARTLGIIGCGWQAESQVACIRAAVPALEQVVAYCRTQKKLEEFCRRIDATAGESHQDAAVQDIVVTATTSSDPVLRGEWLQAGALVCAMGANRSSARELDNVVLERANFVCCDLIADARAESGDLIEPIQQGLLDWLEVHELHEVVAGEIEGRQSDEDIVLFKSNGLASWDVAIAAAAVSRARERGIGTEL